MRTSEAFILGTITGAAVIWLWGRDVPGFVRGKTREVRVRAAECIRAVETQTGWVLGRAEEFLQDTREHVSDALRAGEGAIRPASATGEA
jgi:hypothetical protein